MEDKRLKVGTGLFVEGSVVPVRDFVFGVECARPRTGQRTPALGVG